MRGNFAAFTTRESLLKRRRERVRELGGSFALESASPGTTITVTIPLLQNAEQSRDPEEEDSESIQEASVA
jgi:signal transduction histidine kinase